MKFYAQDFEMLSSGQGR